MPNKKAAKQPIGKKNSKIVESQKTTEAAAQQALQSVKNNHTQLKRFLFVLFLAGIVTGLALHSTNKKLPLIAEVSVSAHNKKTQVLGENDLQTDGDLDSSSTVSANTNTVASKPAQVLDTPNPQTNQLVQPASNPLPATNPAPINGTINDTPVPPATTTDANVAPPSMLEPLAVTVNHLVDQTLYLLLGR